jgi:hypothetical protein
MPGMLRGPRGGLRLLMSRLKKINPVFQIEKSSSKYLVLRSLMK